MERRVQRLVYWTPRVLCILFAAFISVFALDVFSEASGFWQTAAALGIHLFPTFLIVAVLVLSWRREWIGGVLFVLLGALYVVTMWGRFRWIAYMTIAGPLVLIGALFFVNWRYRAELRPPHVLRSTSRAA